MIALVGENKTRKIKKVERRDKESLAQLNRLDRIVALAALGHKVKRSAVCDVGEGLRIRVRGYH